MRGIVYVYIFSAIALFVLLVACVNFMNLTTAWSFNRSGEIGMRKALGALRRHVVVQFFGESLFLTLYALGLALALVRLVLPEFNRFTGKEFTFHSICNWQIVIGLMGITLLTGLIAGSYPALYLSSFRPVHVLRKVVQAGRKRSAFRRALVVLQFSLSAVLIIGTVVVYAQLDYIRNRNIGWERENLLSLPLSGETRKSFDMLKAELLKHPGVSSATAAYSEPTNFESSSGGVSWEGKNEEETVHVTLNLVDYDFLETLNIEMAQGRPFSREYPTDATQAFLINETLARMMGSGSPVGARFSFIGREGRIVGVMKDFHFHSLRAGIGPLALALGSDEYWRYALVRIRPDRASSTLEDLSRLWERLFPNSPFAFRFMEDDYEGPYRSEARMGKLMNVFAGLAVFIACLGLLGLTSFAVEQRRKEIGIRKVLGASTPGIVAMFSKEFLKWVVASNLIAWPIGYFVMRSWLRNFAYRTSLTVPMFLDAALAALLVAAATVSLQTYKAAAANPADSIRYE